MSKVISGISMSLDGFVTGPNVSREQQLGDGGQVLHQWLHEPDPLDSELLAEMGANVGSILMGRLSYDLAEGDGGWGDGGPAGPAPCFVLTHNAPAPETVRAPSVFTFVTDGIHSAVEQAKAAAGDKVVGVHGASAAQQCLAAGLMDEIQTQSGPGPARQRHPAVRASGRTVPARAHQRDQLFERHPPALQGGPLTASGFCKPRAEGVGFEPTMPITRHSRFRRRHAPIRSVRGSTG